jgi:hypothetical protein
MTKHHPNHDPFEEVKFPFVSPKLSCETEHASSPLLELKACPSGNRNVVLDNGREITVILHDISLENKNFGAMGILLSTTCSYENHNHLSVLVYKLFRRMVMDAFIYHKYFKFHSRTVVLTLQLEH